MGVKKYRDVADMPPPALRPPLDPDNLRIACELSRLAAKLSRTRRVPGVRRFRSYDELLRARRPSRNG